MTLRTMVAWLRPIAVWMAASSWLGIATPSGAQDCNKVRHPICYAALAASECPESKRVCGDEYLPSLGSFTCACLSKCTTSADCPLGETCWLDRCMKGEPCNNTGDCRNNGDRCVDGNCGRGDPLPPPECTSDDQCRPTNACGGIRHCSISTQKCVVDAPPVVCPPPDAKYTWVNSPKIGYPVLVEQHTHCEPVAGSTTETRCVTTQDEPKPRLCPPPPVDAPSSIDSRPSLEFGPRHQAGYSFRSTTLIAGTSDDVTRAPKRVTLRIVGRNQVELLAASAAPAASDVKAAWVRDRAKRAWQWSNADRSSSRLERVVLRDIGHGRLAVDVLGRLKPGMSGMNRDLLRRDKSGLQAQVEVVWGAQASVAPGVAALDKAQACSVWVGNCRRTANGGLRCRVPG